MKKKGDKKEDNKLEKQPVIKEQENVFTNERDIAMDFAMKAHHKFDRIIKSSVLFGSQARNDATHNSDIDIIFIIDDAAVNWDLELIAWYREELGKLVAAQNYGKELHINTIKLSTWWQDLIMGEPVIINILRYGEPLIDIGFFIPIKVLLQQGKIRSTHEAVYTALQRAPTHLFRSKASELNAIEGVYWCMADSAQAALMTAGKLPPSPDQIAGMLKETFVDSGMLKIGYVQAFSEVLNVHKNISHGLIAQIRGADIDKWHEAAENFLSEMTRIIKQILENKK